MPEQEISKWHVVVVGALVGRLVAAGLAGLLGGLSGAVIAVQHGDLRAELRLCELRSSVPLNFPVSPEGQR